LQLSGLNLVFFRNPKLKKMQNCSSMGKCEKVGNAPDKYGRTPLHYAAYCGDISAVVRLLRRGANPNAQDEIGQTPLHVASRFDIAKLLLKHGADPNIRTKHDGRTPLHYVAAEGRLAVVGLLLKYGAYLDVRDSYGKTPLYLAVQNRHADVTHYLLKKGANPNVRDERGETPLHIATYNGEVVIAKLLLRYGADPNARDEKGRTPLHFAKRPELVLLLVKHGADPNAKDLDGRTPLHYAIDERNADVIKALLRCGATPITRGVIPT
jgi:ankyrin repeat protein